MRKVPIIFISLIVVLSAGSTIALLLCARFSEAGIVSTLREKFNSDVQIGQLQIVVFPHILARAHGIFIRENQPSDSPPLIKIQDLTFSASVFNLLRRHISLISLKGLQIHIPPRKSGAQHEPKGPKKKIQSALVIDRIDAENALIETLPRDAKHVPR